MQYELIYDPIIIKEIDIDADFQFKKIGQITIQKARYLVGFDGSVDYNLVSEKNKGLLKIIENKPALKDIFMRMIITTPIITDGDIFDIYIPIDPTINEQMDEQLEELREDKVYLYWQLKDRIVKNNTKGFLYIDLQKKNNSCPLCGHDLFYDERYKKYYCSYKDCYAFIYRDIVRYLNVTCGVIDYDKLVYHLIKLDIFSRIEDLYDEDVRTQSYHQGGGQEILEHLFEEIDKTMSKITIERFLSFLPIPIKYNFVKNIPKQKNISYICVSNIEKDFNYNPTDFITFIYSQMELNLIMDEKTWKEKYGKDIERYMSINMFYELFKVIYVNSVDNPSNRNYAKTITKLWNNNVFRKSE